MIVYEIWVWYKGKIAWKVVSRNIEDINRAIANLDEGFTWTGSMS
jgi:hypothetical protein